MAAALGYADADDLMRGGQRRGPRDRLDQRRGVGAGRLVAQGPARLAHVAATATLAPGVVLRDGEVVPRPPTPTRPSTRCWCCGSAVAAAAGRRPHRPRLARPAGRPSRPTWPIPWPRGARGLFVDLLLAGRPAIAVIEALDQRGLWVRILPEWEPVRSKPQRNAYHRFTVDRHLCEAAANAAGARRPGRPARPAGGRRAAARHRQGLPRRPHRGRHRARRPASARAWASTPTTSAVLADDGPPPPAAARRRHPPRPLRRRHDPLGRRRGSATLRTLRLLDALTEADSLATGPAAWSDWKAELVGELVDRTAHVLGGGARRRGHRRRRSRPTSSSTLMAEGSRVVEGVDDTLTVVAPDRPGLFSRVAGVLALNGLDVLDGRGLLERGRHGARGVPGRRAASAPTIAWDRVDARPRAGARRPARPRGPAAPSGPGPTPAPRARPSRPPSPTVTFDNDVSDVGHGRRGAGARRDRRALPHHPGPRRARPRHPLGQGPDPRRRRRRRVLPARRRRRRRSPTPTYLGEIERARSSRSLLTVDRRRRVDRAPVASAGRRTAGDAAGPAALERGAGRHRPHRPRVHREPLRAGAVRGGAGGRRRHPRRAPAADFDADDARRTSG